MSNRPRDSDAPRVLPEPVDVVDGIADRSPRPAWWKYVALLAAFLAWLAFLIYVRAASSAGP